MAWQSGLKAFIKKQGEKTLDQVANDVKTNTFYTTPVKTGRLRRSIHIIKRKMSRLIGSNVPYAYWVEMGTRKMAPRSYLRRALRKTRLMRK